MRKATIVIILFFNNAAVAQHSHFYPGFLYSGAGNSSLRNNMQLHRAIKVAYPSLESASFVLKRDKTDTVNTNILFTNSGFKYTANGKTKHIDYSQLQFLKIEGQRPLELFRLKGDAADGLVRVVYKRKGLILADKLFYNPVEADTARLVVGYADKSYKLKRRYSDLLTRKSTALLNQVLPDLLPENIRYLNAITIITAQR